MHLNHPSIQGNPSIPLLPGTVDKLSSMKLVPGAKKVGDCCYHTYCFTYSRDSVRIVHIVILKTTQVCLQFLHVNVSSTGYMLIHAKPAYTEGFSSIFHFNSIILGYRGGMQGKRKHPTLELGNILNLTSQLI